MPNQFKYTMGSRDLRSGRLVGSVISTLCLSGTFSVEAKPAPGESSRSATFDGVKDYIDFGRSMTLRLGGTMTISAWIMSSSFPIDDAAIVSQFHGGFGYQLDTTADKGPRTIGFKLTNACGDLWPATA